MSIGGAPITYRWFKYLVSKDNKEPEVGIFPPGAKSSKRVALRDVYNLNELSRKVVVTEEQQFGYRYAVFDTYAHLYAYIRACPSHERRLHETIVGGSYQKPRFDIDIEYEDVHKDYKHLIVDSQGKKVFSDCMKEDDTYQEPMTLVQYADMIKDKLIDAVLSVLSRDGVYLDISKNIIVCNTHRHNKASYHIIIDGYMHGSETEAKAFMLEVIKESGESDLLLSAIDDAVYKPNQNFRLLWNHKMGMETCKVIEEEFYHNGIPYTHKWPVTPSSSDQFNLIMLQTTMLTFTSNCEMLPYYGEEKKAYDAAVLTDEETELAFSLLRDKWVEEQSKNKRHQIIKLFHMK